ncbi:uncharacterized protein LOC130721849 [Lotus japonicus]|nr:uncharacterized protein LOC130716184 [Lotus japonicus]XP_057422371.1 uncharacterized protein LOC130716184 [Lotus japonicus]XP_057422372.1 uncharacterized protein LOC130716184 [Lotus japonicus]XP_057428413.1 uncharacterized protein LOC130721849 [Lotus japonicus]
MYDLKRNHWADFSYCGKNKFSIRIFDRLMNQISYGAGPSVRQPDVGSSGKNGEEVVVSDVGDKDEVGGEVPVDDVGGKVEVGGEVSVPVADVGDKDEDGVEVPVPVADVGGEIPLADVGGQFMDVDNIEENDVIMISSDDEEDDGIVQLSDEEEDDGIMQLSDGEEDDGVERVIHNFDKVISSSDSGGGQTMALPKLYVVNHIRANWENIVLQTPRGRTYSCLLKRRNPRKIDTPIHIAKDWYQYVKDHELKYRDVVHFRPVSTHNNLVNVTITRGQP